MTGDTEDPGGTTCRGGWANAVFKVGLTATVAMVKEPMATSLPCNVSPMLLLMGAPDGVDMLATGVTDDVAEIAETSC